eukprot:TRINITY_DN3175_c0_g1_i1.p1 TRINITY_DN3175_c0_g1~~TRINITY_DN3175_c0_g1_i1.p1  ORF type:complete len:194 (+),score=19.78 TRINITY_DN3175_c0_g1_i1:77-658(+)
MATYHSDYPQVQEVADEHARGCVRRAAAVVADSPLAGGDVYAAMEEHRDRKRTRGVTHAETAASFTRLVAVTTEHANAQHRGDAPAWGVALAAQVTVLGAQVAAKLTNLRLRNLNKHAAAHAAVSAFSPLQKEVIPSPILCHCASGCGLHAGRHPRPPHSRFTRLLPSFRLWAPCSLSSPSMSLRRPTPRFWR